MKVYLLWFSEWEANYVLGVFETKEQAEKWKSYFITNPIRDGFVAPDMEYFAKIEKRVGDDWTLRFEIEEYELGKLNSSIKIDNLKYVEHLFTENENAQKDSNS